MQNLRERLGMALIGDQVSTMLEAVQRQGQDNLELMTERLAELELALEDQGWLRLSGLSDKEFSREGLATITKLARLYWLKNPLVKRAVATQTQYVFGQGVRIEARHPLVNQVVQAFLDDPKNKAELSSQQAMSTKETELQCFANLFFVFFTNNARGTVRVRTINLSEVQSIISDPEDAKTPWFYKRQWQEQRLNIETGSVLGGTKTAYYPDWRYRPRERPDSIGGSPVFWDMPVYHVKVNCLSDMKLGVSEIYAAFDWARAYKEFLENWASIVRSYARFAWQLKTKGGAAGVTAAKTKLGTTFGTSTEETNPPPLTGSVFVGSENVAMQPIRTAGATTSANDGRRLLLMVSAATGIYEHFFGDPSTGNLATAKTMNRPMELMFRDRQQLWADIFQQILQFVVDQSAKAPSGLLPGGEVEDDYGELRVLLGDDVDNEDPELAEQPIDRHIEVRFPPMLEPDLTGRVAAIVQATTLGGQGMPAGTFPDLRFVTRLLLQALGEEDIDEIMDDLFPETDEREEQAEARFTEALQELRDVALSISGNGKEG